MVKGDLRNPATAEVDTTQLRAARKLFERASDESGAARIAFLARECENNPALRTLIERMLAADEEAIPLLDQPSGLAGQTAHRNVDALEAGALIGNYRVARRIGVGGMGAVYLAQLADGSGPPVAIKIVRWRSDEISRRFRREREILSGLRHPNIARLLDSGTTSEGGLYFVMEYVEGEPIDAWCDRNRVAAKGRIEVCRRVCEAVIYLHQNLVIHRDLKPGNVLVTADGTVKLVDFGISKPLQASGALLPPHTIAGLMTPDYASPEQIRGDATSTLTDVYALGVLLYELLSGSRPFGGSTEEAHQTLRKICEEEPRKPSLAAASADPARARKLRGELDNIVLKAMQKEPARRYASVEQLDEDLRRYLDGQPVLAQGDSMGYRARKFARRHARGLVFALATLLLLTAGVAGIAVEAGVARRERTKARIEASAAEAAKTLAENARAEANVQRRLAELQASEAERERDRAERRLAELQKLAGSVATLYNSGSRNILDTTVAGSVRDSLIALGKESKLDPQVADVLDKASATAHSAELATDAAWRIPAGWTARETRPGEYRIGVDRRIVHGGKSSLFLHTLASAPLGDASVIQTFRASGYRGARVRLNCFLRGENVGAQAFLGLLARDARARRPVPHGTTPWKIYAVVMDIPENAEFIEIILQWKGTGTLWADDFSLGKVDSSMTVTVQRPENLDFTEPEN